MSTNVFWGLHGALAQSANPAVMMIGDSWFWYPFDNLATELGGLFPQEQFLVVGNNGSEAAEWATKYRKDIDYAFKFYGKSVRALMLSGGGNDVAGMKDFLRIVKDVCKGAKDVDECYRQSEPDALMAGLMGHYRTLITKFRGYNTKAPVILQHYDYAWPTGAGVFGPGDWLKEPMTKAQVPAALRRDLFRDLINRLRKSQLELAKDTKNLGPIFVAKTAGTLPEDAGYWANELHPTPQGFHMIADGPVRQAVKAALS
jgi:hypothetical protein